MSAVTPRLVIHWFVRLSTRRYIVAALVMHVAAWLFAGLDELTWRSFREVSHVFDVGGNILFYLSYAVLWALLVIAPFRPDAHFSLSGSCDLRIQNFVLVFGGLVLVHLAIVLLAFLTFA